MNNAYKILVNNALQNYHFELARRGTNRDAVSHASLVRAIKGLTDCAFGSGDSESLAELQEINKDLSEGNIIEPYVIQRAT